VQGTTNLAPHPWWFHLVNDPKAVIVYSEFCDDS